MLGQDHNIVCFFAKSLNEVPSEFIARFRLWNYSDDKPLSLVLTDSLRQSDTLGYISETETVEEVAIKFKEGTLTPYILSEDVIATF